MSDRTVAERAIESNGASRSDLSLQYCPNCDYSLQSLPQEGTCPECGRPYNTKYLVFTGRGRGRFDTPLAGTWRSFVNLALSGALVYWFVSPSFRWDMLGSFWWLIPVPFMFVIAMFAKLFSPRTPAMQFWMSADGVAQIPSTTEARLGQFVITHLWVAIPLVAVACGMVVRHHSLTTWLIVTAIVFLVTGILSLMVLRRYRAELRSMARIVDGGAPDFMPWNRVTTIKADALKGERARIRITGMVRWGRIPVTNHSAVVDVEIKCTSLELHALKDRLRALQKDKLFA